LFEKTYNSICKGRYLYSEVADISNPPLKSSMLKPANHVLILFKDQLSMKINASKFELYSCHDRNSQITWTSVPYLLVQITQSIFQATCLIFFFSWAVPHCVIDRRKVRSQKSIKRQKTNKNIKIRLWKLAYVKHERMKNRYTTLFHFRQETQTKV